MKGRPLTDEEREFLRENPLGASRGCALSLFALLLLLAAYFIINGAKGLF